MGGVLVGVVNSECEAVRDKKREQDRGHFRLTVLYCCATHIFLPRILAEKDIQKHFDPVVHPSI